MDPSHSPEPLRDADAEVLLDLADTTIATALAGDRPALPPLHALPAALQQPGGVFVTLTVAGELNGCIGTIDGDEPLGHSVPRLALSAAFDDHRLPPLRPADYSRLDIELSLLSRQTPIDVDSRAALLAELRPGHDGVVISAGPRQGLFLPSVWEKLPDPDDFLDHLWLKAGLPPRTWLPDMRASRFTTQRHERRAGVRRCGREHRDGAQAVGS